MTSCATPWRTTSSCSTSRARPSCTPWPTWPARSARPAPVALRVNPDLPPKTHVKTDTSVKGVKFGLDIDTVLEVARGVVGNPHVQRRRPAHAPGLADPVGRSPTGTASPRGLVLIEKLREQGHPIEYPEHGRRLRHPLPQAGSPPAAAFAEVIVPAVQAARLPAGPGAGPVHRRQRRHPGQPGHLHQGVGRQALHHPGRGHERPDPADAVRFVPSHLAGRAGRRACRPRRRTTRPTSRAPSRRTWSARCANRAISWPRTAGCRPCSRGDLLATFSAGAYGMAMSSNYNGRPRAAEVLVDGSNHRLIRRRETYEDLVRAEMEV